MSTTQTQPDLPSPLSVPSPLQSPPEESSLKSLSSSALAGVEPWTAHDNAALTSYLVHTLQDTGALDGPTAPVSTDPKKPAGPATRKPEEPLHAKIRDAVDARRHELDFIPSSLPPFPKASKLDEKGRELVDALIGKLKQLPSSVEAPPNSLSASVRPPFKIEPDEMREAVAAATFQPQEAALVAMALKTLAEANQAALGHNYVFRIMEVGAATAYP